MTSVVVHAKTAFERECGPRVNFEKAGPTIRGFEFSFRISGKDNVTTIATTPSGNGREAIETAASQAGRWARLMAERSAA